MQTIQRLMGVRWPYHVLTVFLITWQSAFAQGDWTVLFTDDFEVGVARRWELGPGWTVGSENDNKFLSGSEHYFAIPRVSGWSNYSVGLEFRLERGSFHANIREMVTVEHARYFVSVSPTMLGLRRQHGATFDELASVSVSVNSEEWHTLKVLVDSQNIIVLLDDNPEIEYVDIEWPLHFGRFSFESLDEALVQIDNVQVLGEQPAEGARTWIRTGGPSGGLGYDVRIHPADKDLMFVTDNPSGINKSYDGGLTWTQRNTGVTTTSGDSGDGTPIFSLTISPGEPNIVPESQ